MKQIGLLSLLPVVLILSCASGPKVNQDSPKSGDSAEPVTLEKTTPGTPAQPVETPPPPQEKPFDPGTISQEKFETTKADVQALIADLNRLIRAKNYNAWRGHLSDSYFEEISSQEFLDERTEELYKRDQMVASSMGRDPKKVQKKLLKNPKDYFDNVVVPSRSNDRMDDIDFVSDNQVKAYTVDNRGQRLVLYNLELIDSKWMIIN